MKIVENKSNKEESTSRKEQSMSGGNRPFLLGGDESGNSLAGGQSLTGEQSETLFSESSENSMEEKEKVQSSPKEEQTIRILNEENKDSNDISPPIKEENEIQEVIVNRSSDWLQKGLDLGKRPYFFIPFLTLLIIGIYMIVKYSRKRARNLSDEKNKQLS